jgi:S-disulfanyl-L-cysteine oxidoreductase SoxD
VQHSLWPGNELSGSSKPDAQGSSCMKNCATDPKVASFIPDYARDAHGNLADQSRGFGPLRGAVTVKAAAEAKNDQKGLLPGTKSSVLATNKIANVVSSGESLKAADVMPNLQKYACIACHGMDNKLVGPSFKEIAAKQSARADAQAYLAGKIKNGGQGVYGQIPMPAQSLNEAEAAQIARWLVQGAKP